jgi:hypothetical protein
MRSHAAFASEVREVSCGRQIHQKPRPGVKQIPLVNQISCPNEKRPQQEGWGRRAAGESAEGSRWVKQISRDRLVIVVFSATSVIVLVAASVVVVPSSPGVPTSTRLSDGRRSERR